MTHDLWTTTDEDDLRTALDALGGPDDLTPPEDAAAVRLRGDHLRRRRTTTRALVAAAVALGLAGGGTALALRPDERPPVVATTPTATASPTTSPSPSVTPTPTSTPSTPTAPPTPTSTPDASPSLVTDLRAIGEDGSLGPFRPGMTRTEVLAVIREAGLTTVRVTTTELGGVPRPVLVGDGLDTGFGPIGLLGTFEKGRLTLLFPPTDARFHGLTTSDPIQDFRRVLGSRVRHLGDGTGVSVVELEGGSRLQLGSPLGATQYDKEVGSFTLLPPGRGLFGEFS